MKLFDRQQPQFAPLWGDLLKNHVNPTALISQFHFDYRARYLGASLEQQVCLVVAEGERALAGTCLELTRDAFGNRMLSAVESPSALILAKGADPSQRSAAETLLRQRIDEIMQSSSIPRLRFVDQTPGGGLSSLTHWALSEGSSIDSQFNQIVDLTKDETVLWRALTKSCQWGVNWGRKNLTREVTTAPEALAALRELHLQAAGFVTRDPTTWDMQGQMLANDEAFVVTARADNKIVSAAFFQISASDCYYSVAASDRKLFDKPLSHSVIWEAILHAKRRGCCRFTLGAQVWQRFHWHLPAPTAKEENISRFKRSFGGITQPEFLVDLRRTEKPLQAVPTKSRAIVNMASILPTALQDPALAHGEVVKIRPLTPDDITDRYLSWFADEQVTRFLEVRTITRQEAVDYLQEGLRTNDYFMCAVCDLQTGVHIGNVKIGPIRWTHSISDMVTVIGDRAYWGRGVASDAIRLAVRVAFQVLNIRKLHASMYSDNIGSLRAYTRAGWRVEGRLSRQGVMDNTINDVILISYFNPNA